MFSGIVEALGTVVSLTPGAGGVTFTLRCEAIASALKPGESVAVDGACLTVESTEGSEFSVTAVATTLERTIAASYEEGSTVNLERALRIGERLDGHFVQGHVDGVGTLVGIEDAGMDVKLRFAVPAEVAQTTLTKGSITLNGVSLTVANGPDGPEANHLTVALVPFTLSQTNLSALTPGDFVNVEADLIGKYVGKMVAQTGNSGMANSE